MKFLLVTFTAVLSIFNAKAQTTSDIPVSTAVLNSFSTTFENATDVQWADGGNYYKADFALNNQHATAFYNADGGLMGVTRHISLLQLPITLQNNLKKEYEAYWISDLFEFSNEDGTSYYLTVEDNDSKITLQSAENDWSVYKKERKS